MGPPDLHVLLCVEFTFASTDATVTNHQHTVDNLIFSPEAYVHMLL